MTSSASWRAGGQSREEVLWRDGERVLCRVWRETGDGAGTTVLAVRPASDPPAPGWFDRLAHEYALRNELESSWAARPLALLREHGLSVLLLDDAGDDPLARRLGRPIEPGRFLRLAAAIAEALARLHQRGLIHRNLTPVSILVRGEAVRLTGFGRASRPAHETSATEPAEIGAGMLAYMAPEQTGRMNRVVDARSDLYALGVTFYEMLTGTLPFAATDPMELIHGHLARRPVAPAERVAGLPTMLSDIGMTLLAKAPEERYQTAAGLAADLRRCLADWEAVGRVEPFALRRHSLAQRLRLPDRLYGRERESAALAAVLARVATRGTPELVLVSGPSGVGKSSLVDALRGALAPRRGIYAAGKFDQNRPDIPYATLAQGFASLLRQLLVKSDPELASWRDAIRAAVGANGRLLADLVPELELLLGPQPAVPDLPPRDAERRFLGLLADFLRVFARRDHPLVLFLDDLQWADAATLSFLAEAVAAPQTGALLAIGACRDAVLGPAPLLGNLLDALGAAGAPVSEIALAPLSCDDVCRLVADTLGVGLPQAEPLGRLIHDRTAGNPLFVTQFLAAMAAEGLLGVDAVTGGWTWNIDDVRACGLTDSVVDLVLAKLRRLPAATREALERLACLGSGTDVATLIAVHGGSEQDLDRDLRAAVSDGILLYDDRSYRFLHDRVQEAAYALIPEARRPAEHLRIGRLLLAHLSPQGLGERLFEVVNQLNRGAALVTDPGGRDELRRWNALAGRKARNAIAYASAQRYLAAASALLPEDAWSARYEETLAFALERCECEYLSGHVDAAAALSAQMLAAARSMIDRAEIYRLRIRMSDFAGRFDDAVAALRDGLALFGWSLPASDAAIAAAIDGERREIAVRLAGRPIAALAEAPCASDPAVLMIIALLVEAIAPAYATQRYFPLLAAKGVNVCLAHGNSADAAALYNGYALVLAGGGDFRSAFEFSDMSLRLVERFDNPRLRAILFLRHGFFVNHWRKHLATSLPYLHESFAASARLGNVLYAGYTVEMSLEKGDPLDGLEQTCGLYADFAAESQNAAIRDTARLYRQFVACLGGATRAPTSFEDADFSEARPLAGFAVWRLHVLKQQLLFLFDQHEAALAAADRAAEVLRGAVAAPLVASHHFYRALTLAALCRDTQGGRREALRRELEAAVGQHRHWAENCPENFANRHALLAAELARIDGRDLEAMRLYEAAIGAAREHGFIQNEAVAAELAGHFYLERGLATSGLAHLRNARARYAQWGAATKVRQLGELYPVLAAPESHALAAPGSRLQALDVATVVKAYQAVCGEIVLPKLIQTLMAIALQSAGADRGLLLLPQGESYAVEAEARAGGNGVELIPHPASTGAASPGALLRYVIRTQRNVILDDASKPNLFSEDDYLRARQPKSVLCLPLMRQGRLMGLLYLENTLASHVFTPERIALLELLAAQAAISLENTRLYSDVREREARIRRLVEANIVGIGTLDLAGGVRDANDALLDMLGYDRADLAAGRINWLDMTPPEWQGDTDRAVAQIRAAGSCKPYEKEYVRKDGSRVPVLVGGALLEGSRDQGVLFVLDLSERKQAEAARRERDRLEAQLQQASRMEAVGRLAGGIAHDFNNILGAAINFAGFLEEDLPPDSPQQTFARRIRSACLKGRDLVAQILAFARAQPIDRRPIDLRDVLREARELLAGTLPPTTRLRLELGEGALMVHGNDSQLGQLVVNLCINAQDALRGAPGEIALRLAPHDPGAAARAPPLLLGALAADRRYARIDVADTGEGIPEAALPRLFEPFFTTKERGRGTGLGLAVVQGVITAHGGACAIASAPGRGTCFSVYLPLGEEAAGVDRAALPKGGGIRGSERVLVVDDAVDITDTLSIGLERLGYEVAAVNDAREALAAVRDDPAGWAVVVTDRLMPEMDGLTLARELHALRADLPIILYTGIEDGALEAAAHHHVFAALLRKPAEVTELAKVIRGLLPG
jgi:PAS domain S-box-containing protein